MKKGCSLRRVIYSRRKIAKQIEARNTAEYDTSDLAEDRKRYKIYENKFPPCTRCKLDKAVCAVAEDFSKNGCNRCVEDGVECSHKGKIQSKRWKKAAKDRKRALQDAAERQQSGVDSGNQDEAPQNADEANSNLEYVRDAV